MPKTSIVDKLLNLSREGNELGVVSKKEATPSSIALEDAAVAVSIGLGEGQSLISSPVHKKEAEEAYMNNGYFDEDQELMLQILREDGHDIEEYVTPDNSPEQMYEIAIAQELGIPEAKLILLADPTVSYLAIQAICKAWKKKIDLTKYLPWADPFVLNQALLGALKGINPDKFIKRGLDHRQIEQLRKEIEAGGDPSKLTGNYNEMRAQRFPESNISNTRTPVPKGKGVSTHSKRK